MQLKDRPILIGILLLSAVWSTLFLNRTFSDGDEGRYILFVEAIATGQGLTNIHLPEPTLESVTQPGYPLLLAAVYKLSNGNLSALKSTSFFGYLIFVAALFILLRKHYAFSPFLSVLLLAISAWGIFTLQYTWVIFSETLYLALALCSILLTIYSSKKVSLKLTILCAIISVITLNIRPVALALLPAIGLHYVFKKQFRLGIGYGCACLVAYIPVLIRTYLATGYLFGYMGHFDDQIGLLEKILRMLSTIWIILPQYFFQSLPRELFFALFDQDCLLCILGLEFLITPIALLISCLVALGFFLSLRRFSFIEVYWILYWPMVSSYHVHLERGIEDRVFLPMIPFAVIYLYKGLHFLLSKILKNIHKAERCSVILFSACALYVCCTTIGAGQIRFKREQALRTLHPYDAQRHLQAYSPPEERAYGRYIEAACWAAKNTPEDSVILSRKSKHTYLVSGKKGFRLAEVRQAGESTAECIARLAIRYPILILQDAYPASTSFGRDRIQVLDPYIEGHQEDLELLYQTEEPVTRLWKLK